MPNNFYKVPFIDMPTIVLLLLYLNTLYLTRCDVSEPAPKLSLLDSNVTSDEGVTETQHATCKIATEELVASARATVTRVLTGACNAKTIDEKFEHLEKYLIKELDEIKSLLYTVVGNEKITKLKDLLSNERYIQSINDNDYHVKDNALSPRQQEIYKYNGTIQEIATLNGSTTMFLYYWQIKNFDEKLANWKTSRSERSPTFYVGQREYAMYIKITPRYFPDGTVFIAVGLTRGRQDSVLKWPFPYKIRLEILDHSPEHLRQDRRSRIWDPSTLCSEYFWGRPKLTGDPDNPECVGLSISRQTLFSKQTYQIDHRTRTTKYLWNGNITIKLIVYL